MAPHPGRVVRRPPWRRLAVAGVLLLGLFCGWLAAGPWLAVRGIALALERRDSTALARHVDFPQLQASLRAQVQERVIRAAGPDLAAHRLGSMAVAVAAATAGTGAELAATPEGVAALLQGHVLWQRLRGRSGDAAGGWAVQPARPLREARLRYRSLSRASLTVAHGPGRTSTWLLQRQGLRWRLVDVRLPGDPAGDPG